jgi:hypothetical protein
VQTLAVTLPEEEPHAMQAAPATLYVPVPQVAQ